MPEISNGDTQPMKSTQARNQGWRRFTGLHALALLTIAAAVLRVSFLASKSIWLDESLAPARVILPLWQLEKLIVAAEMNMYLYYAILHWWISIAGTGEFALRFPSVVFAVATVPLIAALGKELCDRSTGLLAALLLTINATCIQYAQTARAYALLMMLVTLGSLFFVRGLKHNSLANCAGYVISSACGVYAQLFGIMVVPAQLLSLFWFRPDRRAAVRLAIGAAIVGVISLPALAIAIGNDHGQAAWIPRTSAATVIEFFYALAGAFYWQPGNVASMLVSLYLACIAVAIVFASQRDRPVVGYLLLSIFIPIFMTIVVSMSKPLFVTRYLLICLPFFVLTAAVGIGRIRPRALAIAVMAAIATLGLSEDYFYYGTEPMQDWRGAVSFVAEHAKPADALVVYPFYNRDPLDYYVDRLDNRAAFPSIFSGIEPGEPGKLDLRGHPERIEAFLAVAGISPRTRVWFAFASGDPNGERMVRAMQADYRVVADPHYSGVRMVLLESIR